ncbi:MAG: FAD-dependent monooxygenase [Octadecabacter sp.]
MQLNDKIFSGGSNRGRRVCVVGGGIGGLTAALAFARSGAEVEVYEQASRITEVGAGIQLTPNGNRVLDTLIGSNAAAISASITAAAVEPMDALSGRAITRFDLRNFGERGLSYRFFHRADLIDLLMDCGRSAGMKFHVNSKVNTADLDADLIIGAEGIHSGTRTALNGAKDPEFTGQVAWRALVPIEKVDPVARIWMAPHRHVVTYPVYRQEFGNSWGGHILGTYLNIVAVQERSQWAPEGWSHVDDPANLQGAFADTASQVQEILAQVEDVKLWGLFRHPVAKVWSKGNICILGDAAHPTLPFLAQGANLAIEDAFVLARCCDAQDDLIHALRAYEDLRKPRVARAIAAANANARNYHLSGIARRVAHTGLKTIGKMSPDAFLNRMSWLYDHDVTG